MPASTIGIDIGGTKIAAARFDDDFEVLDRAVFPTPENAADLAEPVIAAARAVWTRDVIAIGAGVAGLVRWPEGVMVWMPHMTGGLVDLRTLIGEALEVPVVVDHDANATALAEFELGAARGYDNGILVTVGTGIGGGIIIDGDVHRGRSFAGEVGHMQVVDDGVVCPCGARGCWETLASGSALTRLARREVEEDTDGAVAELAAGRAAQGEDVTRAARAGDARAQALLDEVAHWLGVGLGNLISTLDPEVIVVAGGLGSEAEHFLAPARRVARQRLYASEHRPITPILPSEFGAEAGQVGAALMAWREVSIRFRIRERTRRIAERSLLTLDPDRGAERRAERAERREERTSRSRGSGTATRSAASKRKSTTRSRSAKESRSTSKTAKTAKTPKTAKPPKTAKTAKPAQPGGAGKPTRASSPGPSGTRSSRSGTRRKPPGGRQTGG